MIKAHIGWYSYLYRTWGAVSNYLYFYINRGPLKKVSEKMDNTAYHFLPTRKPQVWYRHPLVTRHSFQAQERYIWLQISLVIFHRALARELPVQSYFMAPYHSFPCIGFATDDLIFMFCDRLPNQNQDRFIEMLANAPQEWGAKSKSVRWIHPLGNNVSVKPFPNSANAVWHNLVEDELEEVLRPDREESFFQVNITRLYRQLNAN